MKKNIIVVTISVIAVFTGVKGVGAAKSYIVEQKQIKIEKQKKAEEERIEAEKKRKEEEEKKKMIIGVNDEGKKYSYDALEVSKKLSSYDYSNNGEKIVFLTFDDGTSTTVTPEVLRILDEEDVKATFFLTGQNIERGGKESKKLIKEEFSRGHAIANHSYSHDYNKLYPGRKLDLEAFKSDFEKTDNMLKEVLGPYFSTRVIRCPGGHMSWQGMDHLDTYLEENNMASIDWNALNGDAEGRKKSAEELVNRAIETAKGKEMVVLLMHDTYGKEETAKALPQIIQYFKENGYEFKTLS
ncbi:polysaccharide deacetylase [Romboutsia weinsteinii]|uniref:Polysaccharide deacetylase n=2 Tax=Romboutsia weinsteinii TaxID=2020949 RepID=A0A371J6Q5_9FIRM|nr:polysaccharide deacetylase [Romboutsia weinsteinii]